VALTLSNTDAIRVAGSPFKAFAEAEEACKAMLGYLTKKLDGNDLGTAQVASWTDYEVAG